MKVKKKILLTGASGTVGFEVLKQLYNKKDKYDITIFDINTSKSRRKLKAFKGDINIVYGNIFDDAALDQIGEEFDTVIHLAAIIPPLADEEPELSHRVNTVGTERLLRMLEKKSPNAFFVYSSSVSVYGDRLENPYIKVTDKIAPSIGDEYAKTKIEAERIIKDSKVNWTIFRLSAIMGGHKVSKLMFHQPLNTALEITTPRDTARAFVHAIEKKDALEKQTFNLGGGEKCRISYEDFLKRSFGIFGLGRLDFLPRSFAEKNFHCGYYADGDDLNDILDFRQDTLETYFQMEEEKVSPVKRTFISLFKKPIKSYLQKQSEPLMAFRAQDQKLMQLFFR